MKNEIKAFKWQNSYFKSSTKEQSIFKWYEFFQDGCKSLDIENIVEKPELQPQKRYESSFKNFQNY